MRTITRTIYGSRLQTAMLLGLPFVSAANTTLNEKFAVQSGVQPAGGTPPTVGYFCIGNGGHRNVTGTDGKPYTSPVQHDPGDAALYSHLPFILREPDNDLSSLDRAKYALRKQITVSGEQYIAYYLKRMDLSDIDLIMMLNTTVDGVTTSVPYIPSAGNLNPTAPLIPPTGIISTTGTYLSASGLLNLNFTAQDVLELIAVAEIMYENPLMAIISEIGLVAGVDAIVTVDDFEGNPFNYEEAIAAQIVTHITAHYPVAFTSLGFDFALEMGAAEPQIGVVSGP